MKEFDGIAFESAILLALIKREQERHGVLRRPAAILLSMVAYMELGSVKLTTFTRHTITWPVEDCAGIVAHWLQRGELWYNVAVYEYLAQQGPIIADGQDVPFFTNLGVRVDKGAALKMQGLIQQFSRWSLTLPAADDGPMYRDDYELMDNCLAQAFIWYTVAIQVRQDGELTANLVKTWRPVVVPADIMINIAAMCDYEDDKPGPYFFFAFQQGPFAVDENGTWVATHLTNLDPSALKAWGAERVALEWMEYL